MINDRLLAVSLGTIGEGTGFGPFNNAFVTGSGPMAAVVKVVSTAIGFITICAGLYFMIQVMLGGFEWISASGDKGKLEKAQNRITHSLIGLIIVVAAFAIVSIIGTVLGLDILLTNPSGLINQLMLQ